MLDLSNLRKEFHINRLKHNKKRPTEAIAFAIFSAVVNMGSSEFPCPVGSQSRFIFISCIAMSISYNRKFKKKYIDKKHPSHLQCLEYWTVGPTFSMTFCNHRKCTAFLTEIDYKWPEQLCFAWISVVDILKVK